MWKPGCWETEDEQRDISREIYGRKKGNTVAKSEMEVMGECGVGEGQRYQLGSYAAGTRRIQKVAS